MHAFASHLAALCLLACFAFHGVELTQTTTTTTTAAAKPSTKGVSDHPHAKNVSVHDFTGQATKSVQPVTSTLPPTSLTPPTTSATKSSASAAIFSTPSTSDSSSKTSKSTPTTAAGNRTTQHSTTTSSSLHHSIGSRKPRSVLTTAGLDADNNSTTNVTSSQPLHSSTVNAAPKRAPTTRTTPSSKHPITTLRQNGNTPTTRRLGVGQSQQANSSTAANDVDNRTTIAAGATAKPTTAASLLSSTSPVTSKAPHTILKKKPSNSGNVQFTRNGDALQTSCDIECERFNYKTAFGGKANSNGNASRGLDWCCKTEATCNADGREHFYHCKETADASCGHGNDTSSSEEKEHQHSTSLRKSISKANSTKTPLSSSLDSVKVPSWKNCSVWCDPDAAFCCPSGTVCSLDQKEHVFYCYSLQIDQHKAFKRTPDKNSPQPTGMPSSDSNEDNCSIPCDTAGVYCCTDHYSYCSYNHYHGGYYCYH